MRANCGPISAPSDRTFAGCHTDRIGADASAQPRSEAALMQKGNAGLRDSRSTRPTRPRRVEAAEYAEDGEALLYHPLRDEATALNRSAAEVWRLCDGESGVDAIAARLGASYGIEGELLTADVTAVLTELRERGLVEFR
ncbi:MAG: PqqD family protein [Pseudomonadota bacterium]|nr:PqqD family protein [Pseudomonadota bacterium]